MYLEPIEYRGWDDFKSENPDRMAPHVDLAGEWGQQDWGVTIVPGTGEIVRFPRGRSGPIQVLSHVASMDVEHAHAYAKRVEGEIAPENRRDDQVWSELVSRIKNAQAGF